VEVIMEVPAVEGVEDFMVEGEAVADIQAVAGEEDIDKLLIS
jgi:hypothetical protein